MSEEIKRCFICGRPLVVDNKLRRCRRHIKTLCQHGKVAVEIVAGATIAAASVYGVNKASEFFKELSYSERDQIEKQDENNN